MVISVHSTRATVPGSEGLRLLLLYTHARAMNCEQPTCEARAHTSPCAALLHLEHANARATKPQCTARAPVGGREGPTTWPRSSCSTQTAQDAMHGSHGSCLFSTPRGLRSRRCCARTREAHLRLTWATGSQAARQQDGQADGAGWVEGGLWRPSVSAPFQCLRVRRQPIPRLCSRAIM